MSAEIDQATQLRSDGELLEQFLRTRQEACFAAIVERHGGMVMRVCQSILADAPDAEDAAQAVFLTLAEQGSKVRGRTSLVGWLYRVAWFIAARAAEARAIRRKHEQEAARMKNETMETEKDDIPAEELYAGMEKMSEKYLMPLLLHHVEGRSEAETASLLGCSVSAVSVRLTRGRKMLREEMLKRGVSASALGVTAAITQQTSASVSPAFVASASQMAVQVASGQVMAAGASWMTLALSKGAVQMLWMARMKMIVSAIAALMVLLAGLTTYLVAANLGDTNQASPATRPIAAVRNVAATATQPTGWVAFKKPGIEVVDCVEVNSGPNCATLALLPDGSTIQRFEGDIPAEPIESALADLVPEAKWRSTLPANGKPSKDVLNLDMEQWKKIARITYAPLVRHISPERRHWTEENPTDGDAQAALAQMRDWLKMAPGQQRDAAKAALVQAVHRATVAWQDEASQKFADQIARVREILTDEQLDALQQKAPAPTAPDTQPGKWILVSQRGDGVYEGRVLLASYQTERTRVNVQVNQGAGVVLRLPTDDTMHRSSAYASQQRGVTPDFLGGDAELAVTVQIFFEKGVTGGRDAKGEYDGAWLLGLCMEKEWDLADFDVTDEQKAKIEEIHQKVIAIENKVRQQNHTEIEKAKAEFEKSLAESKKRLKEQGADEPTQQKAIAAQQKAFEQRLATWSRPNLNANNEDIDQIKLAVSDWWKASPNDHETAGKALMHKLQEIDENGTGGFIKYRALWTQMGAVLTKEQKESMYERLYPKPKKDT